MIDDTIQKQSDHKSKKTYLGKAVIMKKIDLEQYKKDFGIDKFEAELIQDKEICNTKLYRAFQQASDIRKFEIDLYWRRSTYFWTLISVVLVGYFSMVSLSKFNERFFYSLIISSIGLIFTLAWHLANKGSKYWQENWENHLDLLEDNITGPLYKTRLYRPGFDDCIDKYITGPRPFSVSKINQWVSVFIVFVWILLIINSFYNLMDSVTIFLVSPPIVFLYLLPVILVVVIAVFMIKSSGTHNGKQNPICSQRETNITASNKSL